MNLIGTPDAPLLPPDVHASRQSIVARGESGTVPPPGVGLFSGSVETIAMATEGAPEGSGAPAQTAPATATLAYHLATNALGRAHGRAGGYADELELSHWTYAVYSGTNMACLTNSIWSTNCWLHGVQGLSATCIGFSNGMGGQGLMTMISPRHYLCSTHMHPEGFLTAFLDTNNVIYWRKTVQRVDLALDTSVGILNADLPPSVGFLPVATTNLLARLPGDASSVVQGLGMNQQMAVFSQPMNFGNPLYIQWDSRFAAPHGPGTNWNTALGGGDSSSPVTLLIGNQLVLVSHAYGANVGPNYAPQFTAINERMRYLSNNNHAPVYQLTPAVPWIGDCGMGARNETAKYAKYAKSGAEVGAVSGPLFRIFRIFRGLTLPSAIGASAVNCHSMFSVRCSMFDVRCSMFDVRCSMFDVMFRAYVPNNWRIAHGFNRGFRIKTRLSPKT